MSGKIDLTQLRTPEIKKQERVAAMRAQRDKLLTQFDLELFRNQLYWDGLTQAQQEARTAYRSQLMDIPEQLGFPDGISFPALPE